MTRQTNKWPVSVNEGDCFAIPLRNGGYGFGVVARKGRRGVLFGYFFGPKRDDVPALEDVRGLRAEQAVLRELFGDLGIQEGRWPYLGRLEAWDRADWPLPEFGRIEDEARKIAWIVDYENKDISGSGNERRCSVEEARRLPQDGVSGAGAVEIILTKLLSEPVMLMH